jgi:hypothetical protein
MKGKGLIGGSCEYLEAEPVHCHRSLVAKAVGGRIDIEVDHLFAGRD